MRAVVITKHGGPGALEVQERPAPEVIPLVRFLKRPLDFLVVGGGDGDGNAHGQLTLLDRLLQRAEVKILTVGALKIAKNFDCHGRHYRSGNLSVRFRG